MISDDRTPAERTAFLMDRIRELCSRSAATGKVPTDDVLDDLRADVLVAFSKAQKRGAVMLQEFELDTARRALDYMKKNDPYIV